MTPFLRVVNATVFYGDAQALWAVSIEVLHREVVSIVGANGAGKSTLVNAISGLLSLRSGEIFLEEKRVDGKKPFEIVAQGVVQVPEGRKLFPTLTVLDTLELAASRKAGEQRKRENLDLVYDFFPVLGNRCHQLAGTLSGGEQQMLAIGRSLMISPRLLMFDEPSLGLSPLVCESIFSIIEDINKMGTTILLIEQNVLRSLTCSERGYVMENGRITMEGQSKMLLNNEHVKVSYLGL